MDIKKAITEAARIAEVLINEELENPVLKYHSKEEYQALVDLSLTKKGCSESVFFELLEKISLLTPRTNSRAFFNQLFAGRSAPSLSAELLTTVLNTTMHTYKVAGIQVLVEKEIVQQMLRKVGYQNGEGTMNPGGSLSNMMSMMIARNEQVENIEKEGVLGRKMIVYTSVEGHYSIKKNANVLGLGKGNVRLIASDFRGQMDVYELERQVKKDIENGALPFYINATAGTTVLGAFDPILPIAELAKKYGLWLHVDGSLGASLLMSRKREIFLEGIELADSVTWNAHKMMNVPLSASFLLIKEKKLLQKHLSETANYLFQKEDVALDLGNSSVQCGRRVDALKVWAAWKYFGMDGMEQRINHLLDLAEYAAECIEKDALLQLFRSPESVNVCFTITGVRSEDLCAYLHQEGMAMVGYSTTKGTTFVRMACLNADLRFEDIDYFFEQVKQAAKALV